MTARKTKNWLTFYFFTHSILKWKIKRLARDRHHMVPKVDGHLSITPICACGHYIPKPWTIIIRAPTLMFKLSTRFSCVSVGMCVQSAKIAFVMTETDVGKDNQACKWHSTSSKRCSKKLRSFSWVWFYVQEQCHTFNRTRPSPKCWYKAESTYLSKTHHIVYCGISYISNSWTQYFAEVLT